MRRRVSGATWVPAANVLERVLSMLKGWDREVPGGPRESQASKVKTGKEGEGEGNCQKHPLRRALKPRGGEWSERGGAGRGGVRVVESPAAGRNKAVAVQAGVGVLLWERGGGPWAPDPQGRLLPLA